MPGLLPGAVKRQVAAAAITGVLLLVIVALGVVALGAFALALYHRFRPNFGSEVAWWISGGIFLGAALLIGAVLYWRMGRSGSSSPISRAKSAEASSSALALQMAELLREQLPRNAVPATVLALLGGIAVGLNPGAVRGLVETLRRKGD